MDANAVCRFENGALRAVDFTALYRLASEAGERRDQLPPIAERDRDVSGLARIFQPAFTMECSALVPAGGLAALVGKPESLPKLNVKLAELPVETYSVKEARSSLLWNSAGAREDTVEIEIPIGLPRYVNAATLKALLGAGWGDVLFHKLGGEWEICPNSFRIDLTDRSQQFRLGEVQIYS